MGEIVTVNFRGDELYGFKQDDGVFVALKPIVEAMGMDWSAQYRRVQRDPVLAEGIAIMATPFGRQGGQEAVCLKMELVNGWLFTIDSERIPNPEVRDRVLLYKRECYEVLFKHFYKGGLLDNDTADYEPDKALPIGERRKLVTESRQSFGTASARALWFKLGLPTVPEMAISDDTQPQLPFAEPKIVANDSKAHDRAA